MNLEIIFFTAAGFLALLTVILGISNWVFLSSISAKISGLEDEIEKKTSELEAYKKERQAGNDFQARVSQQPADRASETGYPESGDQEIKIVRNVRGGGFENYDSESAAAPQPAPEPPAQQAHPVGPEPTGPEVQSDVLDVVDDRPAAPSSGTITLTLYSNAKKDTDFNTAWKQLAQILQSRKSPRIAIDFNNVMFLYDRELLYLKKFRNVILNAGGTVAFVNCEAELIGILQKSPLLFAHVAGT